MAYSPKLISVPPLALPSRRPRCCLRCLTFRGISMRNQSFWRRPQLRSGDPKSSSSSAKPLVTLLGEVRGFVVGTGSATLDVLLLGQEALQLGIDSIDDRPGLLF